MTHYLNSDGEILTMATDSEKRLAFEAALVQGRVLVLFDMRHGGVVLPGVAAKGSADGIHLGLNYSKRFHMPRFEVTDEYVRAVLSFGCRPHLTIVPWAAVIALYAHDGKEHVMLEDWRGSSEVQEFEVKMLALTAAVMTPEQSARLNQIMAHLKSRMAQAEPPEPAAPPVLAEPEAFDLGEMDADMAKWFHGAVAEG